MHTPQALALRSYHFQKVGKKPELTLVWEPADLEEEPTQQVSPPCVLKPTFCLRHVPLGPHLPLISPQPQRLPCGIPSSPAEAQALA